MKRYKYEITFLPRSMERLERMTVDNVLLLQTISNLEDKGCLITRVNLFAIEGY